MTIEITTEQGSTIYENAKSISYDGISFSVVPENGEGFSIIAEAVKSLTVYMQ